MALVKTAKTDEALVEIYNTVVKSGRAINDTERKALSSRRSELKDS